MSWTTRKSSFLTISLKFALVDPGMRRVGRHDPKAFNLVIGDSFDDLIVGQTVLIGNSIDIDAENARDLRPIFRFQEIVSGQQVGGIRKKPRAHRVTLAGDRIGACSEPPDITGHKREIDDRLSGAGRLVALIDAHRPPE